MVMSPTLEQTLSQILQSLADFFGMTTEAIMTNAPMWLAKYGWYVFASSLEDYIFGGMLFSALAALVIFGIYCCILDRLPSPKVTIPICIIVFMIPFITHLIPCLVAPELVDLEALLDLIGG